MVDREHCRGYLVTEAGAWFPVMYQGNQDSASPTVGTEFVSAFGKRKWFDRGTGPREWAIEGKAPWKTAKNLKALAQGPSNRFYWVSPLAAHTNILPTAAPIYGHSFGIRNVGGDAVEMFGQTVNYPVSAQVPIQPGMRLYGSAYQAGGQLYLEFLDANGRKMSAERTNAPERLSLVETSAIAPPTAVAAQLVSYQTYQTGGYAIRLETHGISDPSASDACWVTMHDFRLSPESLAYAHLPVGYSFTLKEIS